MKPQMYLKYSDRWDDGWCIHIRKVGKPTYSRPVGKYPFEKHKKLLQEPNELGRL